MMMEIKGLLMFIPLFVLGSDNGKYYVCDPDEITASNTCNFIVVDAEAPDGFAPLVLHTLDRTGGDYMRKIVTKTNTDLNISPKPWTNGDKLVTSTEALSGPAWNYVMMFELMAPLRNALMYGQAELKTDEAKWLELTKSLTDCKIKMEATVKDGKPVASTTTVYEKVKAPGGDIHHDVLRYLEEGSIDLVCLTTSLEMSHCDEIRAAWGITRGTYCDCWIPAYTAMYEAPKLSDSTFETCVYGSTPNEETSTTTDTEGSSGNSGPPDGSSGGNNGPPDGSSSGTKFDGSSSGPPDGGSDGGPDGGSSGPPDGSGNGAIANNGNAYLLASVLAFFGLLV